jgi:CubicO group peptidase (beta-lactamase class C family)
MVTAVHTGQIEAGSMPESELGLGSTAIRKPIGMYRYDSIGSCRHGGAHPTRGCANPAKGLLGILMVQRSNGNADLVSAGDALRQRRAHLRNRLMAGCRTG